MAAPRARLRRQAREQKRRRRNLERRVRLTAIAYARWCRLCGLRREAAARRLQISEATLRSWEQSWRRERLASHARGRPVLRPSVAVRNLVIGLFHILGPELGVPTLRSLFPDVARSELEDLGRRYRRVYRRRRRRLAMSLRWRRVGAVWAIDFTQPPAPIDGELGQLLAVRDLGSGKMLASLPMRAATAANVRDLLRALFVEHGAPLVLKSDNGSALVAADVEALLTRWGVTALTSPPGTPRYNGACEAGIGGLKTRAHHIAARHGRPGEWTCDDVEAARLMANEMGRPAGAAGPTPDEAWRAQPAIDANERRRFQTVTENQRHELCQQLDPDDSEASNGRERAAIERLAITQALIALGILELRRRRITTTVTGRRVRKNS